MNDGDTLRLNGFEDVFGGGWPLRGVQTGGTHDVLVAALGQFRVGGTRGDHQNAFVFVDIRRWLRGGRTQVPDDVLDTVVNDFVGDRDGLFWIAGVVILHAHQLVAFDAAFSIDIFDGLTRAVELHIAPLGNGAGHRTHYRNFNVVCHSGMRDRQCDHPRD